MGVVYQLTFFIALGLLAIVVTIFVFAVSQIGKATESTSKEQQDILLRRKNAKAKQIETIERQLEQARKVGNLDESTLLKELRNTKEEIAGCDIELRRLQERIVLIRRKGAVVYPGASLLATLVLTLTASGLTASGLAEVKNPVALILWIISIGTLAFGIYRIFRTLGAIEQVTITSRESIDKLPEAVKVALRELEEEKRPKLELVFSDPQPPFQVKAESEIRKEFFVHLIAGEIARGPQVAFLAPPGFQFLDSPPGPLPPRGKKYANYVTTEFTFSDIISGYDSLGTLRLKAPSQPQHYIFAYFLTCEGFRSGFEEFEVVVE